MVKKSKIGGVDDIYYRGPDQGGGVAGLNYAEKTDGAGLNYKFYNLRGDVVLTRDTSGSIKTRSEYDAFGEHRDTGEITTDNYHANTKYEGDFGLLNEGKRWRSLKYGVFLTPDPLEYVDGFNPYIYCNQNPWGRWDPLGLRWSINPIGSTFAVNKYPLPSYDRSIEVSAWAKYLASSDYKVDSQKSYFVAIEVNFECKKENGNVISDSITLLRPARIIEGKVEGQEIKAYNQDSGNIVDILKLADESISVKSRIALYEGDISKYTIGQSNVKIADFIGVEGSYAKYEGSPDNQTEDMWSAYAQSQISGIGSAYLTGTKTLEDFEGKTKAKPLDKSEQVISSYNLNTDKSSNSSNLKKL